jgi:DNA-binding GntR family transcriptional regulator
VRPIPELPAYARIADELRRQILDGTLAPGSRMPTVHEIHETFGVSTRTAYEATRVLQREGLVVSRPGSRATVRARPSAIRMVRSWYRDAPGGSPWRADMAAQGRVGSWEAHSQKTVAPPAVAERLRIAAGDPVMRTEYVFLADGEPTYLSTSWEPWALISGTEVVLPEAGPHAGKGVVDRMTVIGHAPTLAVEDIVPRTLTGPEAERLGLHAGIPVIVIERTYWAAQMPVETADIVVPPPYRPRYEIPIG